MKVPQEIIDNGTLDHIKEVIRERLPMRNHKNANVRANARDMIKSYLTHRRNYKKLFEEIA